MYNTYSMNEKTTIQIDKGTREKLKQLGRKDETYNEIVKRLIDNAGK